MRRASELECWDTEDLTVEFAAFRFEALKFLDSDVCVMLECKVCDVSCAFSDAVLDEVVFSSSEPLEASPSSVAALVWEASESITANHYSFPFGPDVLAEVELSQDFGFGCEDTLSSASCLKALNPLCVSETLRPVSSMTRQLNAWLSNLLIAGIETLKS